MKLPKDIERRFSLLSEALGMLEVLAEGYVEEMMRAESPGRHDAKRLLEKASAMANDALRSRPRDSEEAE